MADVSLRRTWFWAPGTDDSIKTAEHLARIYEQSLGSNGRIPDADVVRLKEFGEALKTRFGKTFAPRELKKEKGEQETGDQVRTAFFRGGVLKERQELTANEC